MIGLLFTGTDEDLLIIHLLLDKFLSFHGRRGQTIYVGCPAQYIDMVTDLCVEEQITLQQVVGFGESETYTLLNQGKSPAWTRGPAV